jgi:hypothetical protein
MSRPLTICLVLLVSSLGFAQSRKTVQDYWNDLDLGQEFKIETVDAKNDFIRFFHKTAEVSGEFAVWRKKNGGDLIGFTTRGCGPVCSVGWLRFSEPKGKTTIDVTTKVLPGVILNKYNTRFNAKLEQEFLRAYNQKSSEKASSIDDLYYSVFLPQKGTTLRICYGAGDCEIELGRYLFNGSGFVFQAVK